MNYNQELEKPTMKSYKKSFLISTIAISIPTILIINGSLLNLIVNVRRPFDTFFWLESFVRFVAFSGFLLLFIRTYICLKKSSKKSFIFSLVLSNFVWLVLLAQLVMRIIFVYQNNGMERADGYGSPLAFLIGAIIGMYFFVIFTFTVVLGFRALDTSFYKGCAIAVTTISIIVILWYGFFGKSFMFKPSGRIMQVACLSNMKMLDMAMQMYMDDNDGYLPPRNLDWTKIQYKYSKMRKDLSCLSQPAPENKSSYGLNKNLDNINIIDLANNANIIMVFEAKIGKNPRGAKELLAYPPRHFGGYNIGFADGHCKYFKVENIKDEMWGERIKR